MITALKIVRGLTAFALVGVVIVLCFFTDYGK